MICLMFAHEHMPAVEVVNVLCAVLCVQAVLDEGEAALPNEGQTLTVRRPSIEPGHILRFGFVKHIAAVV